MANNLVFKKRWMADRNSIRQMDNPKYLIVSTFRLFSCYKKVVRVVQVVFNARSADALVLLVFLVFYLKG